MNKKSLIIVSLIIGVVAVAGGVSAWQFFKFKKQADTGAANFGRMNFDAGRAANDGVLRAQKARGQNSNRGSAAGKIIEKDETSITVDLANGGSMIVFYSDTTKISKTVDGQLSDLVIGRTITARGTKNSDSDIVVNSVQVRQASDLPTTTGLPARPGTTTQNRTPAANVAAATAGQNRGGFVNGEIVAVNGNNITIKNFSGDEQNITLADDVKISMLADARIDELAQGTEVMATGTKNPDGSITAQLIQIGSIGAGPGAMPSGMPPAAVPQSDQPKSN